jgi:hypothetical protein
MALLIHTLRGCPIDDSLGPAWSLRADNHASRSETRNNSSHLPQTYPP